MSLLQAIADCLFGGELDAFELAAKTHKDDKNAQIAANVVKTMLATEKNGEELKQKLRETIFAYSRTEELAKAVLKALEAAVRQERAMSPALAEVYHKACEVATDVGGFIEDHPVFCTVIVLGILVLLMPWVIEAIGFAAEGPVAGKYQSHLKPYVSI